MLVVAACSYQGDIDSFVARKFTWFSYLDAGDIRNSCAEGTADRYRLVYNARYDEQVRSYEITAEGASGLLVARSIGAPALFQTSPTGLLSPWRWRRSETRLTPDEMDRFRELLRASAMYDGAPVGLRLFSGDFYWIAAACENGNFYFNAWLFPSDRFAGIKFPSFLFAHDTTGLAVNQPRPVPSKERIGPQGRRDDQTGTRFWIQVREQGLGGVPEAF